MFDYKPTLLAKLSTIAPSYYEGFVDGSTELPCITYQEINDTSVAKGDTLAYSRKQFRIKIWASGLDIVSPLLLALDEAMRELGFTRVNYNELWYSQEQVCSIVDYMGLGLEFYGGN